MIRISEFSPSISSSNKNPQAKCKVVINNTVNQDDKPVATPFEGVVYPPINTTPNTSSIERNSEYNELALYKHLALAFANILRNNNPKLIANVLDMSGKVILTANDLVDAVALITNVDRNLITINYEDPEPGCLIKINPIKNVIDIKVNGYDFKFGYNRQYNTIPYHLCLAYR